MVKACAFDGGYWMRWSSASDIHNLDLTLETLGKEGARYEKYQIIAHEAYRQDFVWCEGRF
jgi:hypothetical protein